MKILKTVAHAITVINLIVCDARRTNAKNNHIFAFLRLKTLKKCADFQLLCDDRRIAGSKNYVSVAQMQQIYTTTAFVRRFSHLSNFGPSLTPRSLNI